MKRLFLHFSILITTLVGTLPSFAQACGGGTFTITICAPLDYPKEQVKYQVLPIVGLDSIYKVYPEGVYDMMKGRILPNEGIEQFIDEGNLEELRNKAGLGLNQEQGTVENGSISFKTFEQLRYPCIVKIYSPKKEVYLLANPFGGCDGGTTILWSKYPSIIIRTQSSSEVMYPIKKKEAKAQTLQVK